jgi:cysteine desulfurase/selenocysteine lyase
VSAPQVHATGARVDALRTDEVEALRKDFPILAGTMRGRPLVYLDSAATAQKPRAVIDAMDRFYSHDYASVHRGVYQLAERATLAYEDARVRVARFLRARDPREVVFVRGATEAINLVAASFGRAHVGPGDEIVVTEMEHHSNIVPWQLLCEERGARLVVAPIDDRGVLRIDALAERLSPRTRIVALAHVSNVLGTVNPVREVADLAHARGAVLVVDGAQAAPHLAVDVQRLGCDFYVFSGHKLYGPTGIGVLWGRAEILEAMPPWQSGGSMIASVHFEKTRFAGVPQRFEAGTPHAAGAIGLAAAIDYLEAIGLDRVAARDAQLLALAHERLGRLAGLRILGEAPHKLAVVSFVLDRVHPHDVATILDQEGIAVRAGHHCAQPLMERFGVPATARASFGIYNTEQEIDALARGLERALEVFA